MALEEMDLDYELHTISLDKGEQHSSEFLAMNPNGRIPVIRDRDTGITLFESGAILIYLANKAGRFISPDPRKHLEHDPLKDLGATPRVGRQQASRFLSQIDQDRP